MRDYILSVISFGGGGGGIANHYGDSSPTAPPPTYGYSLPFLNTTDCFSYT